MNITLYKKHGERFAADTQHTYWGSPITDASGLFTSFQSFTEDELNSSNFVLNPLTMPIPNNEIITANGMFRENKLIRSVELNFPNLTNASYMFALSNIEEIVAEFDQLNHDAGGMFAQCRKLKTVRCDFRNMSDRNTNWGVTSDYAFTFSSCPQLESVECNFSSLTNANGLFQNCSKLKNFDCDLSALNTAENMCPNASLTVDSVANIAEKIKPHTDGETHKIDLGLDCTEETFNSDFRPFIETLFEKGWTVITTPINIDKQIQKKINYNYNISFEGDSYTNNINCINENGNGQKKGFAMGTDKDSYFNQVSIKTNANHNLSLRLNVFEGDFDENGNVIRDNNNNIITRNIATSDLVTIGNKGEYIFSYESPFLMKPNKIYYFILVKENNSWGEINLCFSEVTEDEFAYGVIYGSGYESQYSDIPHIDPNFNTQYPGRKNAWCQLKLVEKHIEEEEDTDSFDFAKHTFVNSNVNIESENATIYVAKHAFAISSAPSSIEGIQSVRVESNNSSINVDSMNPQTSFDSTSKSATLSFTITEDTNVGLIYLIVSYLNANGEVLYKDYIRVNITQ